MTNRAHMGLGRITKWARDWEARWHAEERAQGREVDIWFRGEARDDWSLLPSLYRKNQVGCIEDEQNLFGDFCLHAAAYLPTGVSGDQWASYFLAQHYKLPTRLIDWTRGVLIAAFFALHETFASPDFTFERIRYLADTTVWDLWQKDQKSFEKPEFERPNPPKSERERSKLEELRARAALADGRIWALNAPSLDPRGSKEATFIAGREFTKYWLPEYVRRGEPQPCSLAGHSLTNDAPIALNPPQIDRRIIAQRAVFTCHGTDDVPLESTSAQLQWLRISRDWKVVLWHQLIIAGITEDTIFPEMEKAVSTLRRLHWSSDK